MAELEIHHEGAEHKHDPLGQRVGIMAAVLAVLLAVVTISSHRAHTEAIIARSEANANGSSINPPGGSFTVWSWVRI